MQAQQFPIELSDATALSGIDGRVEQFRSSYARRVTTALECYSCKNTAAGEAAPMRERVLVTDHWRAAHAFDTSVPGWLVLLPTVHAESLADLAPAAAAELGPLLTDLTVALRDALRCEKTYVALFAEAEGFRHLHFHVIPRMTDHPEQLRGPRVFAALGPDPQHALGAADMDAIARRVRSHLPRGSSA